MKKFLLLMSMIIGVVMSGIEAKAATTSPDAYPLVEGESYEWAVFEAKYRYAEAYKMIDLVNDYREANGLTRLETNDALMRIAMQRALEGNVRGASHKLPYNNDIDVVLDTLGYNQKYFGERVYMFIELVTTGGTSAENALRAFQNSKLHNKQILDQLGGSAKVAIGVGIVNNECVVCFFISRHLPFSDYDNSNLADYTSVEVVPFMSSIKSEDWFNNGRATIYSTKEAAVAAAQDGSYKKHEDDCDCDDCIAEEEAQIEAEKKVVQATKTTLYSVTKKRSVNNTKVTVKFSKVEGMQYQVQYSFKKNFKSKKTSKWYGTVKKDGTHKKTFTIRGNNSKNVWVRVRAYKIIDGEKVYGKWSSKIKIKTVKKR